MVELLLQQEGIKKFTKDSFDVTPMLAAADQGHLEIAKLLSPSTDGPQLPPIARGACQGFRAEIVDFGMEKRPMNRHEHSVYDLLYGWNDKEDKPLITTLTRNVPAKPKFRWWVKIPLPIASVLSIRGFLRSPSSQRIAGRLGKSEWPITCR